MHNLEILEITSVLIIASMIIYRLIIFPLRKSKISLNKEFVYLVAIFLLTLDIMSIDVLFLKTTYLGTVMMESVTQPNFLISLSIGALSLISYLLLRHLNNREYFLYDRSRWAKAFIVLILTSILIPFAIELYQNWNWADRTLRDGIISYSLSILLTSILVFVFIFFVTFFANILLFKEYLMNIKATLIANKRKKVNLEDLKNALQIVEEANNIHPNSWSYYLKANYSYELFLEGSYDTNATLKNINEATSKVSNFFLHQALSVKKMNLKKHHAKLSTFP